MSHIATGRCTCGAVAYALTDTPMIVHCCHCTWCQRESGSAFALNAVIETQRLEITRGAPARSTLPSASGRGQDIFRCPDCRVALWSHYGGGGDRLAFVRVGTLDDPAGLPPDIHIFTSSRLPWVQIPEGVRMAEEYYSPKDVWTEASQRRWRHAMGKN